MIALDHLKLDLDRKWTACGWARWCQRVADGLDGMEAAPRAVRVTETLRGFHVEIWLARGLANPQAVVAAQAILGSDTVREALNLRRTRTDFEGDWNVLYRRKGQHEKKARADYARLLIKALRRRHADVTLETEQP